MQQKNYHTKSSSFSGSFHESRKSFTANSEETKNSPMSVHRNISKSPVLNNKNIEKSKIPQFMQTRVGNAKDTKNICYNCLKFKQREIKIINELNHVSVSIQSFISAFQKWNKGKAENLLKTTSSLVAEKNKKIENQKVMEIQGGVSELSNIIVELTKDITALSKNYTNELNDCQNSAEYPDSNIFAILKQARSYLSSLKTEMLLDNFPVKSNNLLVRSLTLQLLQSKREKLELEKKLSSYLSQKS